jgi:hypothetical protein
VTKSLYFNYAQKAKGSNMETQANLGDLATEAMIASIPAKPIQPQQQAETTPCADNDKACTKRWIDSFSDCC